jgi:hypothetical protein
LLGCSYHGVESQIGKADVILRIGVRDDHGWLAKRINRVVPFNLGEPETMLWSLPESARRAGITIRVAQRVLGNSPAASLDRGKFGKFPLFSDSQIKHVIRQIAAGRIKVQTRSLKAPKRGCYLAEPLHALASDIVTESVHIRAKRREAEFWANLL